MGNISLRIILFSVLAKYRLIGRVWTFQFIQDHPLGLASRTFSLGWYGGAWVLPWAHHSFGLGEWDSEPILYPHQRQKKKGKNFVRENYVIGPIAFYLKPMKART